MHEGHQEKTEPTGKKTMSAENLKFKVWQCQIVVPEESIICDDGFPRFAAVHAVQQAGIKVISCFSGWNGKLTKNQSELVQYQLIKEASRLPESDKNES